MKSQRELCKAILTSFAILKKPQKPFDYCGSGLGSFFGRIDAMRIDHKVSWRLKSGKIEVFALVDGIVFRQGYIYRGEDYGALPNSPKNCINLFIFVLEYLAKIYVSNYQLFYLVYASNCSIKKIKSFLSKIFLYLI